MEIRGFGLTATIYNLNTDGPKIEPWGTPHNALGLETQVHLINAILETNSLESSRNPVLCVSGQHKILIETNLITLKMHYDYILKLEK